MNDLEGLGRRRPSFSTIVKLVQSSSISMGNVPSDFDDGGFRFEEEFEG